MKVYSLLGFVQYEGESLLGVFGSVKEVLQFVESKQKSYLGSYHKEQLGYEQLGYVESELGSEVDVWGQVEYL